MSVLYFFAPTLYKGLVMLQDMIRAPMAKPMEILLRQASPDTYKDVLKEVKAKEFYNLVIDTRPENMNFFLKGVSSVAIAIYPTIVSSVLLFVLEISFLVFLKSDWREKTKNLN